LTPAVVQAIHEVTQGDWTRRQGESVREGGVDFGGGAAIRRTDSPAEATPSTQAKASAAGRGPARRELKARMKSLC